MDDTTPEGIWYLLADQARLEMRIVADHSEFRGWIATEGESPDSIHDLSWDPIERWLEFCRKGPTIVQWFRLSIAQGIIAGRFSELASLPDSARPANSAFSHHVTGWGANWVDDDMVPRTWQVTSANGEQAVLRIDRDSDGALCGRFKIYAPAEMLEYDLTDVAWDGTRLSFVRRGVDFTESHVGIVQGRWLHGTVTYHSGASAVWSGTRGEVLGFGLGSRLPRRATWQAVTRARLMMLSEGMRLADSVVPDVRVTDLGPVPLLPARPVPAERDDAPMAVCDPAETVAACRNCETLRFIKEENNPNNPAGDNAATNPYTLQRLQFSFTPGSRFDPANPPPDRTYEGYLATPTTPPPPEGYRAVIAINGHEGSAAITMSGSSALYWYGDSLARHGFVVLAIDIGHRPSWDFGPIIHPAIIDAGYADANWEETGERVFSVRRAVDWLLTQPNIRADGLLMTGLSMGGEVTTIASALDERIKLVISAGYSPDMYVTDRHGNHPCYQWTHADIHEYIDASDYEALIAPRPLVVETGLVDDIYSALTPPWAADKQVLRRAYAAYGPDRTRLIHYFHYDGHNWHAGGHNPTNPDRPSGIFASVITEPRTADDVAWQTTADVEKRSPTLYALIDELLPG